MSDVPSQATSLDSLENGTLPAAADEQYVKQILAEMNQPFDGGAPPEPTARLAAAPPQQLQPQAPTYSPMAFEPTAAHPLGEVPQYRMHVEAAAAPPPSLLHRVARACVAPLLVALLVALLSLGAVSGLLERAVPAAQVGTWVGSGLVALLRGTVGAALFAGGSWGLSWVV